MNRIISQSGVTENNKSRAIDYAISGIMSGMTYDEKYQANRGYISPAEERRLAMQEEQQKWLRGQKEQELKGLELGDGSRLKVIPGGALQIFPDGSYKKVSLAKGSASGGQAALASQNSEMNTDSKGNLLYPVIVDKAAWGSGWDKAGFEGEDRSGFTNWWDNPTNGALFGRGHSTRDWGADYKLPEAKYIEPIDPLKIDRKALERIKDRVTDSGAKFELENYNFYTTKDKNRAGIIAVPKGNDPYLSQLNTQSSSSETKESKDTQGYSRGQLSE